MIRWPGIGLWGNFEPCEEGVLAAINQNFFILDVLTQMSIIDFVTELPADPLEGDKYILESSSYAYDGGPNYIMVFDGGEWVALEPRAGYLAYVESENSLFWYNGTGWVSIPTNIGDVTGPSSAVDNTIARFDGITGKFIQDSSVILDDDGNISNVNLISSEVSQTINNIVDTFEPKILINSAAVGVDQALSYFDSFAVRFTGALVSIASIAAPPATSYGRLHIFINSTGGNLIFKNGSSIVTGTGSNLSVKDTAAIWAFYDSSQSKWIIIGGSGSGAGGLVVPNNAARLAIASADRYDGMMVYVQDVKWNFQLRGGIADANWFPVDADIKYYGSVQTLANASAIVLTGALRQRVRIKGNVSGGVVLTLPNGSIDNQELYIQGDDDDAFFTIANGSNVFQNGDRSFFKNQIGQYFWDGTQNLWISVNGGF